MAAPRLITDDVTLSRSTPFTSRLMTPEAPFRQHRRDAARLVVRVKIALPAVSLLKRTQRLAPDTRLTEAGS